MGGGRGCARGGVFLFLNFNFILYVNVRNDLILKKSSIFSVCHMVYHVTAKREFTLLCYIR